MAEIKAGDVVRLKSDGPEMTVEWISQDEDRKPFARCIWFDGTEQKMAAIGLVALQLVDDSSVSTTG